MNKSLSCDFNSNGGLRPEIKSFGKTDRYQVPAACAQSLTARQSLSLCAWRLIPRLETNERECWKFLETGG